MSRGPRSSNGLFTAFTGAGELQTLLRRKLTQMSALPPAFPRTKYNSCPSGEMDGS